MKQVMKHGIELEDKINYDYKGEEEFSEFRKHGICGTDMAAILGISKWKTALDVYKRINDHDNYKPENDNNSMFWGKRREAVIIDYYEQLYNIKLERNIKVVHPKYEFIRGNIDAKTIDSKLLIEAKTARSKKEWGEEGTSDIPPDYLCQVVHYASIVNPDRVEICVLFGSSDFRVYIYERNARLEELLINRAIKFWEENIIKNVQPEPSNLSDISKYIHTKKGSNIVATSKIESLIEELKKLKQYENRINEIKDEIKFYIKDNEFLSDREGGTIAYFKTIKSRRLDSNMIKKEGLYEKYSKETEYRRLYMK